MPSRATLVGLLLGVLLLGGVVGFTVGLPELVDADDEAAAPLPDDLFPSELAGGALVTFDQIQPIEGLQVPPAELAAEVDMHGDEAADRLAEVFDADVAVKQYIAPDLRSARAEVTVTNQEPGLFTLGLPSDPDVQHDGGWFEATAFGDVRCMITWSADAEISVSGGIPSAVQCQRGADGRTYDIRAAGLTAGKAAAALNEIVAHARATESEENQ